MQYYDYTARRPDGKIEHGTITGDNQEQVIDTLKAKSLVVLAVAPMRDLFQIRKAVYNMQHRIKKKNVKEFLEQLGFMLDTNLQTYNALVILRDSSVDKKQQMIARPVAEGVRKGLPLHEALRKSGYFEEAAVMQVKAGEEAGGVSKSMDRLVKQYERELEFISKIKNAMTYPVLIISVMVIVLWILMTMVVPTISQTLIDLGGELPIITKFVIGVSSFLSTSTIYIIAGIVLLAVGYKNMMRAEQFALQVDRRKMHIPVLGKLLVKIELSRFCRNLSAVQKSGIALVPSLQVTQTAIKNRYLKQAAQKATKMIQMSGASLSAALAAAGAFPAMMIQMIEIGVNAGNITEILDRIAAQYEHETDNQIKKVTGLMEPIMIIIVGILAGTVVVSMFLPLMSVMDTMM